VINKILKKIHVHEFLSKISNKIKNSDSSHSFYLSDNLDYGINRYSWKIGKYSYGFPDVIDPEYGAKLEIGSFTSISQRVTIVLANHKVTNISLYPFLAINPLNIDMDLKKSDHSTKGNTIIGSDVWIGVGATILPGVRIGHGAVVAAQSVVTRNIPPYAVVAGNPAKIIKFRFDHETINKLLQIAWWDLSDKDLISMSEFLTSEDLDEFFKKFFFVSGK